MNSLIYGAARVGRKALSALGLVVLLALAPTVSTSQAAGNVDSCIDCHSDPNFLVTNKKLYRYYQNWKLSTHSQEQVSCSDCHGGNPGRPDKEGAHGGGKMIASDKSSPVNYKNIPATCARCHDDIYERYRKSAHFEHLNGAEKKRQGPNCVTCHGSVNLSVLNVNTVRNTCLLCHNRKTRNNPDIPDRAEAVLSEFLSIHRFYRYLSIRGRKDKVWKTFKQVDSRTRKLMIDWHTFDLDSIERQTRSLLNFLKIERHKIRKKIQK